MMYVNREHYDECKRGYAEGEHAWLFTGQTGGWSFCDVCYEALSDEAQRWYCRAVFAREKLPRNL